MGSLTATPTIAGPGYTFDWGIYDDVTHIYNSILVENGATSSINNLASGGYNVTITNAAGDTETFITWVYVSTVAVDISLDLDPINPGCEPFDVNGTIDATGFTYWDPLEPGTEPFIIDANTTIEVCFSANHTWVSDLGFVLIGPPSCGSPAVTLTPNPQVVDNANGCCCNSGDGVNNLCFNSTNVNQFNMCNSGTPLGGTYGFYNGAYPGTGGGNYPQGGVAGLYGCNAAEGGWAVQIYDCIGADIGSLTAASITFSNGTSTIEYDSGAINSAINDGSCDPATASIYVVPLTTPIIPDPQIVPNSGTLTYQLGLNGAPVTLAPGTNSFTQNIDPIPTYDEWYYLFIQDELGCSAIDSSMFDFTGYADATIDDINPTNFLCVANNPVQMTAATTGGVWSGTGVDAAGLFDPAVAGVGTHTITYTISDPCGDLDTKDIIVGDLTANTSFTASVCNADNGTATITPLSGVAPYNYTWTSTPVQNTQTAIDLPPGDYDVTMLDDDGCELTTTVTVPIDLSDLTVSIPNATDALCNASCDGTATSVELGGTAPYQFIWDDPTNQTTPLAIDLCAGTYNVGVADVNGCLATAQVVIAEPTAMVVNTVMDTESNCNLPDGEVSATANGGVVAVDYGFSWDSTPIQNTAAANGLVPNTYTVSVTDDNGCVETATVDVTSTPGFTASIINSSDALCFLSCDGSAEVEAEPGFVGALSYSWDTTPAQATATATNLCAGTYQATITDAVGCIATADVTITEPVKVSAIAAASASPICIGESTDLTSTLDGGTAPYVGFSWTAAPADVTLNAALQNQTVSPVVTTEYTFVGTDNNGCDTDPAVITVIVYDPLTLDVTRPLFSPDTAICPYDSATINLQGIGGDGNYSYFLQPDLQNPITVPMRVQPDLTTGYAFVVTDGCTTPPAFANSTITVHVLPNVDFVADELTGCDPHSIELTDLTNPTPASWSWNFDDPNSSANTSPNQNPTHTFSGAGLYDISLSVISPEGCAEDTVKLDYIEVYPLPYANFSMDPEITNVLNGEINFTDLSAGQLAGWEWSFGTGDISLDQHPIYNYTDTGTFLVWMRVTTDMGCQDETTRQVTIEPDFMFYVPNSFTPNNDGKNDYFRGYGEGIKWETYEMSIYNRWGEEIYFTKDIDDPWNGWFKNKDAEVGVYVWKITLFDQNGERHTYRGHVNLIR